MRSAVFGMLNVIESAHIEAIKKNMSVSAMVTYSQNLSVASIGNRIIVIKYSKTECKLENAPKKNIYVAYKSNQSLSSVIENESKSVLECQWCCFLFLFLSRSLLTFGRKRQKVGGRETERVQCIVHCALCVYYRWCRQRRHRRAPYVMRKMVWILCVGWRA